MLACFIYYYTVRSFYKDIPHFIATRLKANEAKVSHKVKQNYLLYIGRTSLYKDCVNIRTLHRMKQSEQFCNLYSTHL